MGSVAGYLTRLKKGLKAFKKNIKEKAIGIPFDFKSIKPMPIIMPVQSSINEVTFSFRPTNRHIFSKDGKDKTEAEMYLKKYKKITLDDYNPRDRETFDFGLHFVKRKFHISIELVNQNNKIPIKDIKYEHKDPRVRPFTMYTDSPISGAHIKITQPSGVTTYPITYEQKNERYVIPVVFKLGAESLFRNNHVIELGISGAKIKEVGTVDFGDYWITFE